jgi:hypothetical protein
MVYGRKSKFDNLYLQICKKWGLPFKEIEIKTLRGIRKGPKNENYPKAFLLKSIINRSNSFRKLNWKENTYVHISNIPNFVKHCILNYPQ